MKLAISNIAWSPEDDKDIYKLMKKNAFSGLEIAPTRLVASNPYTEENIINTKKIFQEIPFKVVSMQSILYGRTERIFGTSEERNSLLSYLKLAIDYAYELSINNLVFGSPKNRVINNYSEEYKLGVDFFAEASSYAEEKNVVLAIEPNPVLYNTNYINFTKQAFELVRDVSSSSFKINIDFGTIIYNNENLYDIREYISQANHIHISEPNLELIEKRDEHKLFRDILIDNGYDKYISIEMKNLASVEKIQYVMEYVGGLFNADR